MATVGVPLTKLAGTSGELWADNAGGGWATLIVVGLLLAWQLLRSLPRRRFQSTNIHSPRLQRNHAPSPDQNSSLGISNIITEADLRDLVRNLERKFFEPEKWEEVVEKKNGQLSYSAKCYKPRDGPLKYLSITTFEKCTTELLRNFYMDNEFRKKWDKTVTEHKQLQVDETSGTEIGQTIKKFPFLTPREYVLAWRLWEGNNKTFYCLIKDCEHPLTPRQKKYVRVQNFRSGWCIRKVPGRDACEITLVHQEDAGMNVDMAKLAFAKGIWSYVCKMNGALREYSSHNQMQSASIATLVKLIKKVPQELEMETGTTSTDLPESSVVGRGISRQLMKVETPGGALSKQPTKKLINGLLFVGGIICLSRGRSTLGAQLAMACILKKLMKRRSTSGHVVPAQAVRNQRQDRG